MNELLSPESDREEIGGRLGLEELAEELEGKGNEEISPDLAYKKHRGLSKGQEGCVYVLNEVRSEWYDETELESVEIDQFELNIQEIKINAVTGQATLVNSSSNEIEYEVYDTSKESITFTKQVGKSDFVFRYDRESGEVRAAEIGGSGHISEWRNPELKKQVKLIDSVYQEASKNLWQNEKSKGVNPEDSKFGKFYPIYKAVTNRIEEDGEAIITKYTHVGKARGADIKNDFKRALTRAPDDSLDNYTIENDGDGYPIRITKT